MTNRIKITSGSASPFRVSASGVDVNGATFNGLIFDGNQKPLRVYTYGYIGAPFASPYGVALTGGPYGPSTPSGTSPLFTVCWYVPVSNTGSPPYDLCTVGGSGTFSAGGTFSSSNQFSALTFKAYNALPTLPNAYVNYLIFRNAG